MFRFLFLFMALSVNIVFAINPTEVKIVDDNSGSMQFDAFSRLETGAPYTLGDYIFSQSLLPLDFSTSVTSTGAVTHNTQTSQAILSTQTNNDIAILMSNIHHRYQAGKAGKVVLSLATGGATEGVIKRWGYFDENNGIYYQLNGSTFSVCQRTKTSGTVVDNCVDSGSFNGKDYNSKLLINEIDFTKANIYEIDFQWLGAGLTRFKVQRSNGKMVILHEFKNPNTIPYPYMQTANLPIRYYQKDVSSGGTPCSMRVICCSVVSNGGSNPPEVDFAISRNSLFPVTATESSVVAIRLKENYNGLENRAVVFPRAIVANALTASVQFKIYVNSTITGGAWTSTNSLSRVEYNTAPATCTGGRILDYVNIITDTGGGVSASGFGAGQVGFTKLRLSRNAFNTSSDNICISAIKLDAADAEGIVKIQWGEVE